MKNSSKYILFILIGFFLLAFTWYLYETKIARPAMTFMGVPDGTSGHAKHILNHTLRNQAFMIGYSKNLKNPLWVTYKVTQNRERFGKRPRFQPDWRRCLFPVSPQDFRSSGFDRGHMAPNYMIGSRYGRSAQIETFLMTNISPQKASLNRKSWQRLEEIAADHFSKKIPEFWVVTGPIFDENPKTIKDTSIAIPRAFYKIFIALATNPEQTTPKVLAMIFPQEAKPNANLLKFVSNVDEIERLTGLDFFWELPDNIENKIEQTENHENWQLKKVANRKNRY